MLVLHRIRRSSLVALAVLGAGCGGASTVVEHSATGATQTGTSSSAAAVLHPTAESIPAGDNPHDVVVAGGKIWVADFGGPVLEFDAHGHRLRTIKLDAQSMAAGAGGVWVGLLSNSNTGPQGPIAEIDARRGQVSRHLIARDPADLLAVGDGAVWSASRFAPRITRIPLAGGPQRSFRLPGTPTAIALGRSAVWVAVGQAGTPQAVGEPQTGSGQVLGLDAATGAQLAQEGETAVPTSLVVAQGKVWVALADDVNALDELDEATGRSATGTPSINVGKQPTGLASGNGSVWALNYSDGTVTRVDPVTGHPTATIAIGPATDPDRLAANTPIRLALAPATLWVTDAQANTLRRVPVR
jgi:streptogramin lyase